MYFYYTPNMPYFESRPNSEYPHIRLVRTNWDDYGWKGTFRLYYYLEKTSQGEYLGDIKIINEGNDVSLEEEFVSLDEGKYFSRFLEGTHESRTPEFHTVLKEILSSLNDIIYTRCTEFDMPGPELRQRYVYCLARNDYEKVKEKIYPYHYSKKKLEEIKKNLEKESDFDGLVPKLLYASIITTLESYLEDVFRSKVLYEKFFLENFLKSSFAFRNKEKYHPKYFARYVHRMDLFLKQEVEKYIKEKILFHKIDDVKKLYQEVLGLESIKEDLDQLKKHVKNRHEIFHRLGENVRVDKNEVLNLIEKVTKIIEKVEAEIKNT